MIQTILFDLDGTLLNTLTDLANSCNHALALHGHPTHPVDAYKLFVGGGKDNLIHRALGSNDNIENFKAVGDAFSAHYSLHSEDCTAPYEGIIPFLNRLEAKGIASAVVSNKPHPFCQVLVPKYFGDYLSPVLGHVAGTPAKPDPILVHQAMHLLGADPATTLYVGDSGVDMETAKNGGLPACGVLWGFRGKEELLERGADYLCETVEELDHLINQL